MASVQRRFRNAERSQIFKDRCKAKPSEKTTSPGDVMVKNTKPAQNALILKEPEIEDLRAQRRRAVRNILFAGGSVAAAGQWAKPVVDSISLPAHAQLTGVGFSITDPVFLSYTCSTPEAGSVLIDVNGFVNVAEAGIRVRLVLSWSTVETPTQTSPFEMEVTTEADGSYSWLDVNIGYGGVNFVEVTASLPDFPEAGTAEDSISPEFDGGTYPQYYCQEADS